MQNIQIDFITNRIIVTKAFLAAAREMGSEEYTELHKAVEANPNMTVATRSNRVSHKPNKNKGLDYKYMRNFIRVMDKENLSVFEDVIAYYECMNDSSTSVYHSVREWFLDNYPDHREMIVSTVPKRKLPTLPAVVA